MRTTLKGAGFPLPFLVENSVHGYLILAGAAAQNLVPTEGICYIRNSSLKWTPPKVPTYQTLADPHKGQEVPRLSPATTVDLKPTFHSDPVGVWPRGTGPPENSAQSWHPAYPWIQTWEPLIPALRGQDSARGRAHRFMRTETHERPKQPGYSQSGSFGSFRLPHSPLPSAAFLYSTSTPLLLQSGTLSPDLT